MNSYQVLHPVLTFGLLVLVCMRDWGLRLAFWPAIDTRYAEGRVAFQGGLVGAVMSVKAFRGTREDSTSTVKGHHSWRCRAEYDRRSGPWGEIDGVTRLVQVDVCVSPRDTS